MKMRKESWNEYEKAVEQGPMTAFFKVIWRVALVIGVLVVVFGGMGYVFGWFGESAKIAQDEFGPAAMLKKYTWFKEAAAQLDKKQADIQVYEGRIKAMDQTYKDVQRVNWAREDREQYNVWSSEVAGVKASYNGLAAEYNSNMAKFNWRFANQGDLPPGAEKPLPREFKPYTVQ